MPPSPLLYKILYLTTHQSYRDFSYALSGFLKPFTPSPPPPSRELFRHGSRGGEMGEFFLSPPFVSYTSNIEIIIDFF